MTPETPAAADVPRVSRSNWSGTLRRNVRVAMSLRSPRRVADDGERPAWPADGAWICFMRPSVCRYMQAGGGRIAKSEPAGVPTNSLSSVPPIERIGSLVRRWDQASDPSATQYAVTSPRGLPTRTVRWVVNTRLVVQRSGAV